MHPTRRASSVLLVGAVFVSSWAGALAGTPGAAAEHVVERQRERVAAPVAASVSRTAAKAGGKVVVSGKLPTAGRRGVVLQTQVPGSWQTLATGSTNAKGRFALRLPTTWYHRHTLRVLAPEVGGNAAATSRTLSVRVKPSYRPAGDASDHELPLADYRWNPCEPITWRFRSGGGFDGSLAVVKRSLVEITRGTGLAFRYAGTTTKVPVRDDADGAADLIIGWATPQEVPELGGGAVGYGGATATGPSQDQLEIAQGAVALDQTESLAESYAAGGRVAWGQVVVHELGHAIGLGHTSAADQLMSPTATTSNARLGAGDLRGMQLVGLAQGCWDLGAR